MAQNIPPSVDVHYGCTPNDKGTLIPRGFTSTDVAKVPWNDHNVVFFGLNYDVYPGTSYAKTVEEKIKMLKISKTTKDGVYLIWPGRYSTDIFYLRQDLFNLVLAKLEPFVKKDNEDKKLKALQDQIAELYREISKMRREINAEA